MGYGTLDDLIEGANEVSSDDDNISVDSLGNVIKRKKANKSPLEMLTDGKDKFKTQAGFGLNSEVDEEDPSRINLTDPNASYNAGGDGFSL